MRKPCRPRHRYRGELHAGGCDEERLWHWHVRCRRCHFSWMQGALFDVRRFGPRYIYLGDRMTDPALRGLPCDPVRRRDGRCIVGRGNALVRFADGSVRVVLRRRLRLTVPT